MTTGPHTGPKAGANTSAKSGAQTGATELDRLTAEIRACRLCRDAPVSRPLPHDPRPVLRVSSTARILIAGQAPGTRVHDSGTPFTDPSGDRLRDWMAVTPDEFYDASRIAILPMGFCFPGLDAHGSDLPPRRECAAQWRARVMALLTNVELVLAVGGYAFRWHVPTLAKRPVSEVVAKWRQVVGETAATGVTIIPLPHPSWRNSGWLKRNPWFDAETVPDLRARIRHILGGPTTSAGRHAP